MPGDPEFFILKQWAWMDAAEYEELLLGAFVQNYADPAQDVTVPEPGGESHLKYAAGKTLDEKTLTGKFTDFVVNNYKTEKQEAGVVLKSLAGVSFSGETTESASLSGKFIRYRRLKQLGTFFEKAKEDDEVKSRVPSWIKLSDKFKRKMGVCMIVGVMICESVDVEWGTDERKDAEGNIEIPLDKIMMGVGVPNPLGDAGNPQASTSSSKSVGRIFKVHSEESKIFALQLKPVTKASILRNELILQEGVTSLDKGRILGNDRKDDKSAIPDDELFLEEPESD